MYGALEECCKHVDVEAWTRGLEVHSKRAVGVGTWRHRGMERLRCFAGVDVQSWKYRALEVWRRAAGVAVCRYGATEA